MTDTRDGANNRSYTQVPTPFETRAPQHTLKITRFDDGSVVKICIYKNSESTNPPIDEADGVPTDAKRYRVIKSLDRAEKGKHLPGRIPRPRINICIPVVEAPFLLIAEMDPSEDEDDFNDWYNQEHVPMVADMPGYVRCRRYQIVSDEGASEPACKYLTIHEVQDLNGFLSPPAIASGATSWAQKHMSQVKGFKMTGWKLLDT